MKPIIESKNVKQLIKEAVSRVFSGVNLILDFKIMCEFQSNMCKSAINFQTRLLDLRPYEDCEETYFCRIAEISILVNTKEKLKNGIGPG